MAIAITLDWERCPDGVEVFDHTPEPWTPIGHPALDRLAEFSLLAPQAPKKARYVRARSSKVERFTVALLDAKKGLVLDFIGSIGSDGKHLVSFMSEHGLPTVPPDGILPLASVEAMRVRLEWLLLHKGTDDGRAMAGAFNSQPTDPILSRSRPLPTLLPRASGPPLPALAALSLYDLMEFEMWLLLGGEARVVSCDNCGKLFTVGPTSGKRSHSKHCSPRCSVAAHRANKRARLLKKGRI